MRFSYDPNSDVLHISTEDGETSYIREYGSARFDGEGKCVGVTVLCASKLVKDILLHETGKINIGNPIDRILGSK